METLNSNRKKDPCEGGGEEGEEGERWKPTLLICIALKSGSNLDFFIVTFLLWTAAGMLAIAIFLTLCLRQQHQP